MPKQDRLKTKYPGVYYIDKGNEKVFYIIYYLNGKKIEEKAGKQFADDMTAAKAAGIRAERSKGKEPSNKTRREQTKAVKLAEAGKMTLSPYGMNTKRIKQTLNHLVQIGQILKNT